MANSDRFDELFRQAFQRVDVPEPPELDWRALAKASARGRSAGALADRVWGASLAAGVVAVITLLFYSGYAEPRADRDPAHRSTEMLLEGGAASSSAQAPRTEPGSRADMGVPNDRTPSTAISTGDAIARTHGRTIAITTEAGRTSSEVPAPNEHHSTHAAIDPPIVAGVSNLSSAVANGEQVDANGSSSWDRSTYGLTFLDLLPLDRRTEPGSPHSWTPAEAAMPAVAHWGLSPWVSLDHTSYADAHEGNDDALDELRMDRGFTGSVGARVSYSFDERLAVYTGIQWAWKGALKGTIRTSPYQHADYDLSGQYLEIPIGFRFTAPKERWSFYARGGALLQFNMRPGSDNIVIYDMAAKEMSTLRLASNSMGIAGEFAAGLEFRVGRGLSMFVEPVYRAGFTPIVQHPSFTGLPLNPREQTLGLATGIVYQFRSHR